MCKTNGSVWYNKAKNRVTGRGISIAEDINLLDKNRLLRLFVDYLNHRLAIVSKYIPLTLIGERQVQTFLKNHLPISPLYQ